MDVRRTSLAALKRERPRWERRNESRTLSTERPLAVLLAREQSADLDMSLCMLQPLQPYSILIHNVTNNRLPPPHPPDLSNSENQTSPAHTTPFYHTTPRPHRPNKHYEHSTTLLLAPPPTNDRLPASQLGRRLGVLRSKVSARERKGCCSEIVGRRRSIKGEGGS